MSQETPLAALHRAMGGRMVDFSGWSMPVTYGSQIEEHQAVRQDAGMFDVSHMTVVDVHGPQAEAFLRILLANDVAKLKVEGAALYSVMLNAEGGVIDDLIVYRMAAGFRLVVNCATRSKDLAWIAAQAKGYELDVCEQPELAIIAVQGPAARERVHQLLSPENRALAEALGRFHGVLLTGAGADAWFVARTGYTGEDGYEIVLPGADAAALWQALTAAGVRPCGLGARDTLRLEAGMNLYGHEMDETVSPLAANLGWTLAWTEGRDFIGRAALERELKAGVQQKLVGLVMQSRGVLREGYPVTVAESGETGVVTSGTFSPSLGCSIALARVPINTDAHAEVVIRDKKVPVRVVKPCFVRNGKPIV